MRVESTEAPEAQTVKIVVAAEAGNGKTTLASTLNEPVLVISAEAGLLSLRGKKIDFIELQKKWSEERKAYVEVPKKERIQHLVEIFEWVQRPEQMAKYRWLFIDSLTEVNQLMEDFLDSQEEFQGPKNTIKKYGELSKRMMSLCKAFRDLPGYNVVFSALVKQVTDSDNRTSLMVSMTGSFAEKLPALFDEILYLGVMAEVDEKTGRNVRQLLTQRTDKITFPKDRSGKLNRTEPADLSVIVQKIRGKPAPVIADISSQAKQAAAQAKEQKAEVASG